jgi:HSP90 family molecular chaperone
LIKKHSMFISYPIYIHKVVEKEVEEEVKEE